MTMNRILVVDDEEKVLKSIQRIFLDEQDIELKLVDNGAAALQEIQSFKPDAVLLDILMPGQDGYEICRIIKSDPRTTGVMVLLVSGKTALEDRLKGYEVAADDYITKPYDPEELKAKVRILLRLKKIQDALKETNQNLEALVAQRTRELMKKERQALVGQLAQGVVHNLKGPLTAVYGFSELAKDAIEKCILQAKGLSKDLEDDLRLADDCLDKTLASSEKLTHLINTLMAKGRKDASREKTLLDLNEVVTSEVDFLQADFRFKYKIKKKLDLAPDLPHVLGLHSDFSQVFCNLIRNATDAMLTVADKELTIRSTFDTNNLFIDFMDTGTGIDPSITDRIFDPFFSTKPDKDSAQDEEAAGTGLGLYTCFEIIKSYEGEITAKNLPDKGTCLSVRIPYKLS